MKNKFYWHLHHDVLLEPLTEPLKNRIEYIKESKPKNEIELRLKLLKPVRGKLPDEIIKVGEAYYKAQETSDKARKTYYKAWETYYKMDETYNEAKEACDKIGEAYDKTGETYNEAKEVYNEAKKVYDKTLKKYSKEINELHEKECPNCSWNGKTIFN